MNFIIKHIYLQEIFPKVIFCEFSVRCLQSEAVFSVAAAAVNELPFSQPPYTGTNKTLLSQPANKSEQWLLKRTGCGQAEQQHFSTPTLFHICKMKVLQPRAATPGGEMLSALLGGKCCERFLWGSKQPRVSLLFITSSTIPLPPQSELSGPS